tara:strand:+ start:6304 stop:6711 length:408 start_codon:yes stop_codon:yes gene_type:complete
MNSEEDEFNRIEREASLRKAAVKSAVGKGFTLGITKHIESNITFTTSAGKEVMRIDKNGVKINPDFSLDEAAQHVINALDAYVRGLVQAEREACAKVCDDYEVPEQILGVHPDYIEGKLMALHQAAAAIRARGNT